MEALFYSVLEGKSGDCDDDLENVHGSVLISVMSGRTLPAPLFILRYDLRPSLPRKEGLFYGLPQ